MLSHVLLQIRLKVIYVCTLLCYAHNLYVSHMQCHLYLTHYLTIFIHISVMQVKTFFETMRTRFGKISAKKSGQGLKKLSHREQFMYLNFRFLWGHIRRTASRQSDTVSTSHFKYVFV